MSVQYTESWDLACGRKRDEKGIKKIARKKRQRLERRNERRGSKKK
jgi:hypothetical protein